MHGSNVYLNVSRVRMAQGPCAHTPVTLRMRGVHAENIGAIVTPDEYLNVSTGTGVALPKRVTIQLLLISPVC